MADARPQDPARLRHDGRGAEGPRRAAREGRLTPAPPLPLEGSPDGIDLDALGREVLERLEAAANPRRAEFGEGYYPTAMQISGARVPEVRRIAREIAPRLRTASPATVLELAMRLIASNSFDARHVAYELLTRRREAFAALKTGQIEALGAGMDNWASVDAFASLIAGPAWLGGQLSDARIARWRRSPDRWWRRAALASTVTLNKKRHGEEGDAARTLAVCAPLVGDRDDMVVKALSWALRSLSERDPEAVRAFLEAHDGELAARVRREVRRKLETGRKN